MLYDVIKGYVLEIRTPVMLVALLTAILGSSAATVMGLFPMNYSTVLLHTCNVFTVLYMSHLVDTLNDRFTRNEYGHGYITRFGDAGKEPLTRKHFTAGIAVSFLIAVCITTFLTIQTGLTYLWIAAFGVLLALAYGSGLDCVLLLGDFAWEMGVIFALWGGYYVQAVSMDPPILLMALIVLPALTGFKIVDALPDIEPDRNAGKNTIPVKIGFKYANILAYGLIGLSLMLLGFAVIQNMLPPPLMPTVLLFGALSGLSATLTPRRGVYLLLVAFILLMLHGIYLLYPPLFNVGLPR